MKQYEYKCVAIWGTGEPTTRKLNDFGREGWELVEVVWCWHYFKRELKEKHYAYFGRIRTLIPETSGQRFGIIRTA